jgi:PEP-CTERM motif
MSVSRIPLLGVAAFAGGLVMAGLAAHPATAGSVTFAFGSLANNATDTQVQTLMNSALGTNGSVIVTGAVGSNSYNADGHVTGPANGSSSYTLANLDSAGNGTFIQNDTGDAYNDILMSFKGLTISSVSFEFEIFPDDSCTSLSGNNCGGHDNPNQPDLTLLANGAQVVQWIGLTPGSSGNSNGVDASSYLHSPASGSRSDEEAPQLLGSSGVLTLPINTTSLDFQDWPATIAIDDLVVNFSNDPSPAPEPGTVALLGSALFGFVLCRRYRRHA